MGAPLSQLAARPLLRTPRVARVGSRFLGFGAAQPAQDLDGHRLGERFDRSAEWIRTRTGIEAVRRSEHADQVAELAVAAGRAALAHAGRDIRIDLVIAASCSMPDRFSERIVSALAPGAALMTMNAACSGFCFAVSTADALIRDGSAQHVLVVAAEHMSGLIDPADLGTSIIFGDGAGAAVLGPAGSGGDIGVGPVVWGSDGSQAGLIACSPDGRLRMAGQQVFRWAVETMPDLAVAACDRAGVTVDDIDVFVPHQANLRIIDAVARKIGLQRAVVASDVSRSGNTSAASIPIALTRLLEDGRARAGQLALLLGFGAGLAYAGQVVAIP